jgi:tetratricopeptide (TPR) repeat protein
LCIDAPGGIGKTRLLQELRDRYRSKEQIKITEIIDFDDPKYHVVEYLEISIGQMLDKEIFTPFLRNIQDYRKMELAGISSERLKQEFLESTQSFIHCFNKLSEQKRVVILFDTIEKLEGTDCWTYLLETQNKFKNCVICMAGRTARSTYELLQSKLGDKDITRIIDLRPLEDKAGREYLQKKQELLHIELESKLIQKLLLLSGGRPILIDLAAEWRAHGISLDWLAKSNLKKIKSLPKNEIEKRRQEFEKQLVIHIAQTRSQMDWLILLMSHVYPLDTEMIIKLLDTVEDEAKRLFEEAKIYVFVKLLPDGRITLHDEMRRMINEYVWSETDPGENRRRHYSELTATYLESKIENLKARSSQLEQEERVVIEEKKTDAALNASVEREILAQEIWFLKADHLKHTLFVNIEKGVKTFIAAFNEATKAYRYHFRKTLLEQMQKYAVQLSPEQQFEVDIRQAKYLLDDVQYLEAKKLLEKISCRKDLRPDQKIDTLIQRANIEIRLGKFLDGIRFFKEAVQISREHNLREWLAKSETGLGWAYRLTADFQEAGKYYEMALDLAIEMNNKHQQALLYVNWGFVYAYYIHIPNYREKALWLCEQALSLWEELDDARGIGRTYSTLGCIKFMNGQFDEALSYFQKALDIFEPVGDREWLSIVYSWRGAVYISKNQLDLAESDLRESLEQSIQKDRLMSLSRLGRVYLYQNKLQEAQQLIEECHQLALNLPDVLYQLISLRDMAELASYKREYHRLEEFEGLLTDYREKWGEPKDIRACGMLYFNLGRLALGRSNMDKTIGYLQRGLQIVVQQGRYGNDIPQTYMERFQKFMVEDLQLSAKLVRDIGAQLLTFWQKEGLDAIHPDIRILLSKWAKWEGK